MRPLSIEDFSRIPDVILVLSTKILVAFKSQCTKYACDGSLKSAAFFLPISNTRLAFALPRCLPVLRLRKRPTKPTATAIGSFSFLKLFVEA